jgi:hypothetical protein
MPIRRPELRRPDKKVGCSPFQISVIPVLGKDLEYSNSSVRTAELQATNWVHSQCVLVHTKAVLYVSCTGCDLTAILCLQAVQNASSAEVRGTPWLRAVNGVEA